MLQVLGDCETARFVAFKRVDVNFYVIRIITRTWLSTVDEEPSMSFWLETNTPIIFTW